MEKTIHSNSFSFNRSDLAAEFSPEVVGALADISEAHVEFVRYASGNHLFLNRAQFKVLDEKDCCIRDPIQAWPTLVDELTRKKLESASIGLSRLIKRIPAAVFGMSADLISEFYNLEIDFIRHFVLGAATEQSVADAIGRGDFIMASTGLWCLEFNISSNLGGLWEAKTWGRKMMRIPVIAGYLKDNDLHARSTNSFRLMMQHFLNEVKRSLLGTNRQANVAYILATNHEGITDEDRAMGESLAEDYREALRDCDDAMEGSFLVCAFDDLSVVGGHVLLKETHIHLLVECMGGDVPLHILRCYQLGNLIIHNGPITYLLCNKLNMAVLSELQNSDIFTEEERELIRKHVPWTRKVEQGSTDFHGLDVSMPSFVYENRQNLVLKKSISRSGHDVVIGMHTMPSEWARVVSEALAEKSWIVQEHVKCRPFLYQFGEYGCCPHDVVWGLFVFGETYGGAFLRMSPRDHHAIVNSSHGSYDGVVLEVTQNTEAH